LVKYTLTTCQQPPTNNKQKQQKYNVCSIKRSSIIQDNFQKSNLLQTQCQLFTKTGDLPKVNGENYRSH